MWYLPQAEGVLLHVFDNRSRVCALWAYVNQQISKAAVVNDSKAILVCGISRKQKACSCTSSTTGAAYAASGAWHA